VKRDDRLVVRIALPVAAALVGAVLAACSNPLAGASPEPTGPSPLPAVTPSTDSSTQGESSELATTPSTTPSARAAGSVDDADRLAGIRSRTIVDDLGGRLVTVAGDVKAPGKGDVLRVKVQVEKGLGVDGEAFADFALGTLNDSRSWGHGGRRTFARTDGAHDLRVVLASPATSARMCEPLVTGGRLSCRSGNAAVITWYRWVKAIPDYGTDRTGYRRYVVNHEVGHVLGHSHEACPGKGKRAPVMMQQTKGLLACKANPWPFP
jgi:hypothetical protein